MLKNLTAILGRIRRNPPVDAGLNLIERYAQLSDEERRYLTTPCDDSVPLPPGAVEFLSTGNSRLLQLRKLYGGLDLPVCRHSQWNSSVVSQHLDLRYFRGDNPFIWHYRELPRTTQLKFFVYLKYLQERDTRDLLSQLTEDGAFGCWTFDYPGYGRFSRDLLDSINEILFLDRALGIFEQPVLRVLDIGAGYGRFAHRMVQSLSSIKDYACVDAVPESTFLSEYYLQHRGCTPSARVLSLDMLDSALQPGMFDLAVNIHSFSECTYEAVQWWMQQLARLRVQNLLIIPNQPTELLTTEPDKSKKDFLPLVEAAGYRLAVREAVFADTAVQNLLKVQDHFHLFKLKS